MLPTPTNTTFDVTRHVENDDDDDDDADDDDDWNTLMHTRWESSKMMVADSSAVLTRSTVVSELRPA